MIQRHLLSAYTLIQILLIFVICAGQLHAQAQIRQQYTGSNAILIGIESARGIIDFSSDKLQVRYNKLTNKIECRLPVNTLYPLNDSIPPDMAYHILFGSKYPEIILEIDAPAAIINEPSLDTEPQLRRTSIEFQGTINEKKIPVVYASDKGVINLSTNFDLLMQNFSAAIPESYIPFINGRLHITIRSARWLNNTR